MTWITLTWVQELTPDKTHQEKTVHRQSHHLRPEEEGIEFDFFKLLKYKILLYFFSNVSLFAALSFFTYFKQMNTQKFIVLNSKSKFIVKALGGINVVEMSFWFSKMF